MRKRLKKQYNTGGNTGIGADLGAGLLQGIGMGSQFGLPGAILGGAGGLFLGANQGIINRNNMLGYEDERKLREEKIAADEARMAAAQNQAILEQYPVEGTATPRFTTGGDTDPVKRTHTLADLPPGVLKFVIDSPRLMEAAATLDNDQMQRLINQAGQAHDDLEGKSDMEKLSYFKDMDLSWVKPLREKAGLSKADIVNEAVEGGLIKKAMKYPVLGASMLKSFSNGGPTGDTIKQWNPGILERIGQAFDHTFNPFSAIGYGVDNSEMETSISPLMRARAIRETEGMLTQDKNDILPDWVYEKLGVKPKMELGGPTGQGEFRPMPDGINMTVGLSGASNPHEAMIRPDGGMENLLEFIDPTGLTSWDDAYRAYQGMKRDGRYLPNFGEAADMFGAIPLLGKVGKGAKLGAQMLGAAGRGINLFDTAQDLYSENLAMGGMTGPRYEAEGGEMIQYKDGETPRVYGKGGLSQKASNEFEIKGPSHANGGVDMSDEKGARIYSDKLTVDSALAAKLMKL